MAYVLESGDALRIVVMGVVALIGIGASVAWIPAFKFDPMVIPARLFLAVTVIIITIGNPVTVVLGIALAALAVRLWWRTQAIPEVPRPHLLGVVMISLATGAVAFAALIGWSSFGRLPDAGHGVAAVFVAAVGSLGVLAAADRSRVRLRDAIRRRFHPVDIQLVPAAGTDSVFIDEDDDRPATTLLDAIDSDAARAETQQRADDDVTVIVEQLPETDHETDHETDDEAADDKPADGKAAAEDTSDQPTSATVPAQKTAKQEVAEPKSAEQEPPGQESAEQSKRETPAKKPARKPTAKPAAKKPTKKAAKKAKSGGNTSNGQASAKGSKAPTTSKN